MTKEIENIKKYWMNTGNRAMLSTSEYYGVTALEDIIKLLAYVEGLQNDNARLEKALREIVEHHVERPGQQGIQDARDHPAIHECQRKERIAKQALAESKGEKDVDIPQR